MKLCQRCGQAETHWRHRENYQPAGSGYYHRFEAKRWDDSPVVRPTHPTA